MIPRFTHGPGRLSLNSRTKPIRSYSSTFVRKTKETPDSWSANKWIGLLPKWWSGELFPSSPRRGGCAIKKTSRSTLSSRSGDERSECKRDSAQPVISGVQTPQNSVEFDHHPVRSIKEASRYFIEVAATPPRRGGELRTSAFGQQPLKPATTSSDERAK